MDCKSAMQHIVILDSGLKELSGHHPSIVMLLNNSPLVKNGTLHIDVLGNKKSNQELKDYLYKESVHFIPHFDTEFYQHFYSNGSLNSFTSYVQKLTKEYIVSLRKYSSMDVTFLHHTLNWEHALSLSLALEIVGLSQQHIVCLMFNPYTSANDITYREQRIIRFGLGFRALSKKSNVKFFAADFETRKAYMDLLGDALIDYHPCGLISKEHLEDIKYRSKDSENIILYFGDAKDNKGFLDLPKIVKGITEGNNNKNTNYIIHYTITNDRDDLAVVERELHCLAKKDNRIKLYSDFMSDVDRHRIWMECSSIVINYDEKLYANQSSGILWLSAAYEFEVHFLTQSWLNREAVRLGLKNKYHSNIPELVHYFSNKVNSNLSTNELPKKFTLYKDVLLSDFTDWLVDTVDKNK